MTSQPSTERTARTNRVSRRTTARRGLKKRGILPSFGDLVLPVVSVAAIGLLIVAGRQFFLNGLKTSPGISSTRAYAEAPAIIAERERKAEAEFGAPSAVSSDFVEITPSESNLLASSGIKEESKPESENEITAVTVEVAEVKPASAAKPKPAANPPAKSTAKKEETPNKTEPVKTSAVPASKQWRVQIGAYTTKAGAQEAAKKINKAGYKATVYSNPASKHFKVWVQGGADKKSAEKVAAAMQKIGYKGSFAFPPSK